MKICYANSNCLAKSMKSSSRKLRALMTLIMLQLLVVIQLISLTLAMRNAMKMLLWNHIMISLPRRMMNLSKKYKDS